MQRQDHLEYPQPAQHGCKSWDGSGLVPSGSRPSQSRCFRFRPTKRIAYNDYTPTEEEVSAVRGYLGEDTEVGQVIAIQAETGSRVGAITKLRPEHIDLSEMRLTLDDKGGWRTMEYPSSPPIRC